MKIIAANWKMNNAFDEADAWIDSFLKNYATTTYRLHDVEVVLCPPAFIIDYIDSELMEDGFRYLEEVMKSEKKNIEDYSPEELTQIVLNERPLKVGAQDCHHEIKGSFTGDISASMLKKVGCAYVIVGHSERRANHFETSEIVGKKVKAVLEEKMTPIICVGESKEIREQEKHLEFIYRQIMNSVPKDVKFDKLVIAYEPIWSIGTGVVPSFEQIAEVAKLVKKIFDEKFAGLANSYFLLYGGSVTSENSAEILKINGIDGLLVGKASLDAEEFVKICIS
jgi:triosephosphate isomerase (TIM)